MNPKNSTIALAAVASMAIISSAVAGPAEDGNAGLEALKNGDYARAVTMFTRALNSGTLSGDDKEFAYSQRGAAYLKQGNAKAAIADFNHALKLKPDDQDAQAGLEEAQSQPGGGSPRGKGGGSSARPEQEAQAGMEALNGGDYARAIQIFTRAINSGRLSPDDKELALLSRGKAHLQRGDYREAVTDLNQALHIKSDDQEALEALGKALGHMQARTPVAGIDGATCTKNFSTVGSILTGKTYASYAEYPSVSTLDSFAGVYSALSVYTPVPGMTWQITGADIDAGAITATIIFADSGRAISLEAHITPEGGGSKITIQETVPGLLPTIDLKGSLCHTLAAAPKG
jgi:tetratricopeptide (TPR) repeat protein